MSAGEVVIVGATSGIARALATELARAGYGLVLLARDEGEAAATAADLTLRFGVATRVLRYDALDFGSHAEVLAEALAGDVAGAVVAIGHLGDQAVAQRDWREAQRTLDTNFTAAVLACERIAERLEERRRGWLCVLSSVAGDRGRQSNYLYGAAKGGLSTYTQGLSHRLARAGVSVTTIKPGFVDTAMTYGKPGLFLVASPAAAARGIMRAIGRRRAVAYVPGFWALIMAVIRAVPRRVFERTRL